MDKQMTNMTITHKQMEKCTYVKNNRESRKMVYKRSRLNYSGSGKEQVMSINDRSNENFQSIE